MKGRLLQLIHALTLNKGMKLIALGLGAIAWYAIQPAISFEATISNVPIRVMVDSGWAVLEQSASSADVLFRGSREGIRLLDQEDLEIVVDARAMNYSEPFIMPLEPRTIRTSAGVRALFARPSEVTLIVDQEEDLLLPVREHIQGSPPEGYEVESVRVVPDRVTVSGPRQRLEAIEAIRTTPIDMEGRLQSFNLRVGLVSPSRAWTARLEPDRVEVEVNLVERSATRLFEDVRVHRMFGATVLPDTMVTPSHANVTLVGRAELLEAMLPRDLRLYVDVTAVSPGESVELPVRAHVPARIRVEKMEPAKILLEVPLPENAEAGE